MILLQGTALAHNSFSVTVTTCSGEPNGSTFLIVCGGRKRKKTLFKELHERECFFCTEDLIIWIQLHLIKFSSIISQ